MVVPTKLKLLRGNPGRRPIRPEPQPRIDNESPKPPDYLGKDARAEWLRVAPELYRLGLLTVIDISALAAYCNAFGRWTAAEREVGDKLTIETSNGNTVQNPLVGIANAAARDMVKFAAEFGLSPAARRRLSAVVERPAGKFDGLIA